MTNARILTVWYVVICTGITLPTVEPASISNSHSVKTKESVTKESYPSEIFEDQNKHDLALAIDKFYRDRTNLLNDEVESSFGSNMKLNKKESLANKIIMAAKNDELKAGLFDPHSFNPARHIFDALNSIKQSKLFQIIKKMPKGGILHIHKSAMCSADYMVSLTYWSNLWQRTSNNSNKLEIEEFRFSRKQPQNLNEMNESKSDGTMWRLVRDVRAEMGASIYDKHLRSIFTLYDPKANPTTQFKDVNDAWEGFNSISYKIRNILMYKPARYAYYKRAFREMYEDGVQYVEIRASLSKVHDLDGNFYTEDESIQIYFDAINEFKREHPLFIGAKFIYSRNKLAPNEKFPSYFDAAQQLYVKYPELVVGFDLVGQEDKATPLMSYADQISHLPDGLKFYFHAGETNWFGSVDENLIDAVLLGSRRIGHGFALAKHPKVIDLVKSNDIAVEVNPISNQVLKLVSDIRNHPASMLFAQNVPIVISSDDPSFWEVSPLSHDFYFAFLGIASHHSDLRTLKQLALNSILYSSLEGFEKLEALMKWQIKWDAFIDDLVRNYHSIHSDPSEL